MTTQNNNTQAMTTAQPAPMGRAPLDLLSVRDFAECVRVAEFLSQSPMVPPDYHGKPASVVIAMDYAARLKIGLMPMMQGLTVINGRPALWGDLMLAVVLASPMCEYIQESFDDETMSATCKAKRVGMPEVVVTWTVEDAQRAGKWGSKGPWSSYPKRMLAMRARAWALRNAFTDVLLGLQCAEEVRDYDTHGAAKHALQEPPVQLETPKSDKYVVDAVLEDRPIAHEPQPKDGALPAAMACIASAQTLDDLKACRPLLAELTPAEHEQATEAGRAKKQAIMDAALEAAAETARQTEQKQ